MWLVVDANQARQVPVTLLGDGITGRAQGLTLSPFLLAEILLRGGEPRRDTLTRLRQHDNRIGIQPAEMMELVADTDGGHIPTLTPFPDPDSELDLLSRRLLYEDDYDVTIGWAKNVKGYNSEFCGGLVPLSTRARNEIKRQRIRRVADFSEALGRLAGAPDSFLGSLVNTVVTDKGRRSGQGERG